MMVPGQSELWGALHHKQGAQSTSVQWFILPLKNVGVASALDLSKISDMGKKEIASTACTVFWKHLSIVGHKSASNFEKKYYYVWESNPVIDYPGH